MSAARRRELGPGTDRPRPEPPARDPRTLTAAERAAVGEWTVEPAPVSPQRAPVGRRRVLGTGPADPGTAPKGP
ncbi:hypothetical protein OH736_45950 (plasmid) [Streptomyces sp. NBC_01650]|uniref:hypothetical protein n=1 Tax=Streptomyces sp. NBC_01650 TaxID=2975907 RepID=UPI00386ACA84|nr:hypothetical protein OH736_45950 [Streptomyces sp. NBC_01650]